MVVVNDTPSEPRTLEVSEKFSTECLLTWQTQEGIEYQFRVSAENKFGVGNMAESEQVKPENPWSVPDPVFTPDVSEVKSNSMLLTWEEPSRSNGAPIEGYFIEMKDNRNPKWRKLNRAPITKPPVRKCEWRVLQLIKGLTYEFRVCAINKAGPGPYGPSSDPVLAEDPVFVPSPPSAPEVVDTCAGEIALKWQPPASDGNTPIIGYMISVEDEITMEWSTIEIKPINTASSKPTSRSGSGERKMSTSGDTMTPEQEAELAAKANKRKASRRMSKAEFE